MVMKRLMKSVMTAAVAVTAMSAFGATTNPVQQWDWRLTSGFTAWQDTLWQTGDSLTDTTFIKTAPTPGYTLRDANGNPITAYNSLEWGKGTVRQDACAPGVSQRRGICQGNDPGTSMLSINNPTSSPPYITASGITSGPTGSVNLGVFGDYSEIGRFRFSDNPVLASSAFLDKATYTANLVLRANGDPSTFDSLQNLARSFQLDFFETNNPGDLFGSAVRCAAGTGSGASGTEVAGGCGDIFVVRDYSLGILTSTLVKNGFEYLFQSDLFVIDANGVEKKAGLLSDEVCALASQASGCYGFITGEGVASNIALRTRVLVRAAAVSAPEPTAFGLLGLGLAGLALVRRRKA
jgi:hypothetical protein